MNFKELSEKYNISDEDISLLNEMYVTAESFNALNGKSAEYENQYGNQMIHFIDNEPERIM